MSFKTKSVVMQDIVNANALRIFGITVSEAHEKRICVCHKKPIGDLSDLDRKEYEISGLCPKTWEEGF